MSFVVRKSIENPPNVVPDELMDFNEIYWNVFAENQAKEKEAQEASQEAQCTNQEQVQAEAKAKEKGQKEQVPVIAPTLNINEPEKCMRFRSKSETDSHGALKGALIGSKPGVELLVPPEYANLEFIIICQLYEPPTEGGNLLLSPHSIKLCGQVEKPKKKNVRSKNKIAATSSSPYVGLICQTMSRHPQNPCRLKFQLDHHFIQNPLQAQYQNELVIKYENLKKWKESRAALDAEERAEIKKYVAATFEKSRPQIQVCLGFEVFTREVGKYTSFIGPVLSKPIYNGSPLRINLLYDTKGSVDGGNLVVCLLSEVPTKLRVFVYHFGADDTILWKREIEILAYLKKNQTITFTMPTYDGPLPDCMEIPCQIEVVRTIDDYKTGFESYIYINEMAAPSAKRRRTVTTVPEPQTKRQQLIADSMAELKICEQAKIKPLTEKQLAIEEALKAIQKIGQKGSLGREEVLAEITRISDDYAAEQDSGNSLLHDVIAKGDFLKLYKMSKTLKFEALIRDAINDRRQNLLHSACELNRPPYIRPLIGLGCSIVAQDLSGNTALHCALLAPHNECIEKFRELMRDTTGFAPQTIGDLKSLLGIRNRQGQSVLHLAALRDRRQVVADMLQFCKAADISDVCALRELGTGNTILHLAATKHLQHMMQLIMENVPQLRHCKNYDGEQAEEL